MPPLHRPNALQNYCPRIIGVTLTMQAFFFAAHIRAQDAAGDAAVSKSKVVAATSAISTGSTVQNNSTKSLSVQQIANGIEQTLLVPLIRFSTLDRVINDFNFWQRVDLPIAPPAPSQTFYAQSALLRVFDTTGFPPRVLSGFVPESYKGTGQVYRVTVCEDPVTRARVISNANGREIWRQAAPANYDPWAYLRATQPWAVTQDTEKARKMRAIYDPSRIRCEYLLMSAESVPAYAMARAELEANQLLNKTAAIQSAAVPQTMRAMIQNSPASSDFIFTDLQITNGIADMQVHLPDGVTCRVDVFYTTFQPIFPWALGTTTPATSGTFRVQFPCTTTNAFFMVGNADIDSDQDGLPDARENLMYGTNPHNFDTSGDGMSDGWKVTYGLSTLAGTGVNGRNKLVAWWCNNNGSWLSDLTGTNPGPHYGNYQSGTFDTTSVSAYPAMYNDAVGFLSQDASILVANDDQALSPQTNFSFAAWLLPTTPNKGGVIINKQNVYSLNGICDSLGRHQTYTFTIYTNTAAGAINVSATATIPTNIWVHVAGVYDYSNSNLVLYVNGTAVATKICHQPLNGNTATVYLGASPYLHAFPCYLGDSRFFDSALSPAEVAAMNQDNQMTPGGETMLQAYSNCHPPTADSFANVTVTFGGCSGTLETWCQGSHQYDTRTVTFTLAPSYTGVFKMYDGNWNCVYSNTLNGGTYTLPWSGPNITTVRGVWSFTPTQARTNSTSVNFSTVPENVTISATSDGNPAFRNAADNVPVQFSISGPPNDNYAWSLAPASVANGATITPSGSNNIIAVVLPKNVVTNYTVTGKCAQHNYSDSSATAQVNVVAPTVAKAQKPAIGWVNTYTTISTANNSPYSANSLTWTITPTITGGATFSNGVNTGSSVTIQCGAVATSYVVTAKSANYYTMAGVYTNASDSTTLYAVQLVSQTIATTPANQNRTTIGVGEKIVISLLPANLNAVWNSTCGSIIPSNGEPMEYATFVAPNLATSAIVTATLGSSQTALIPFTIVAPNGYAAPSITPVLNGVQITAEQTANLGAGCSGAGMFVDVFITPTNVSFYNVQFMEMSATSSNATGYFANANLFDPANLTHTAGEWAQPVSYDNSGEDTCYLECANAPWASGSYSWSIPAAWRVAGNSISHPLPWSDQCFSIDTNGTVTIQKFGRTVTRNTNNVYTTVN